MAKLYKIRKTQNGKGAEGQSFINYSLTIPSEIATKLDNDMRFVCELTDDGILFRPATEQDAEPVLPEWAKNGNGTVTRKRPGA